MRLANTTAEEFEDRYAYSTTPVIVTDATHGWKALTVGGMFLALYKLHKTEFYLTNKYVK